jgi:hypothetical protein
MAEAFGVAPEGNGAENAPASMLFMRFEPQRAGK